MNKCVICGKDSGKGKTCGSTCRSKLARSVANATVESDATVRDATPKIQNTPEFAIPNFGLSDCQCQHCKTNRANGGKHTINHGQWKPAKELGHLELNRVSLPGDVDYTGVCSG